MFSIFYQTDLNDENTVHQVTDDGGWCIDSPRILGTVYPGDKNKCIYNGVPEWNYEEEGGVNFGSRSYWAKL